MPLTNEERQRLLQWFDSKEIRPLCPICGHGQWEWGDIIAGLPRYQLGSVQGSRDTVERHGVPMVQIICDNCGHVVLFAATVAIGTVDD